MKEKYDSILSKINIIINELDPIGLIKIGAPKDEYFQESLMIFERINKYDCEEQITNKLWDVFYNQFCYGSFFKIVNGERQDGYMKIYSKEEADKYIGEKYKYKTAALEIKKLFGA